MRLAKIVDPRLGVECNEMTSSYFFFAEVESDLPDDIKEKCVLCFQAALANHMNIGDAIKKVQNEPLKEIDERFKGQRFKGFIKFDYETNVITINVNKFAGGNSQSSAGIGTRKSYAPDPFMGRLSDPNMNKR